MAEKKKKEEVATTPASTKKKKVKVLVMSPRDEVRDGFLVWVNGVETYVPYNEEVEVSAEVADVINSSNKAAKAQRNFEDKHRI